MAVIDLTHLICEEMPVYPGTEKPRLEPANTIEKDGFCETYLHMYSHTGTHMDAPAHLFSGRRTLDAFPAEQFTGAAVTLDVSALPTGAVIGMDALAPQMTLIRQADFVIFYTGFEALWGTDAYYGDYPTPSLEVAQYLADSGKKGVGTDAIGIDPIASSELPIHRVLLSGERTIILENLCHLRGTFGALHEITALPLKYAHADGAPARVILRT